MKPTCLIYLATAIACVAADPVVPPKQPAAQVEAKAAAWIKSLGKKGLVIHEIRKQPGDAGFVGRPVTGSQSTMFVFSDNNCLITLGFDGTVDGKTPLENLRQKFSFIALDKVPTPGLEVPGWEIKPLTPISSLRKAEGAVEILAGGDGRISLRVRTHFFALSGRDPGVLVPADAPSPPGSYFQIRERFELDLTLEVPFAIGK
jgi:hypothetical protein